MRTCLILILTTFFILSCTETREKETTPKSVAVVEGEESGLFSYKRSGSNDLVDKLFNEALKNDKRLQSLYEEYKKLTSQKLLDSTKVFREYYNNSLEYYSSSKESYTPLIKDSLLRQITEDGISKSQNRFLLNTKQLSDLDSQLRKKVVEIEDRIIVLKLKVTLKMLEEYQKDGMPNPSPMEALSSEMDKMKRRLDSAVQ
ncbi:MAG: hypothetical protein J0M30_02415 [Chitinophagales bacterium]|nr:hypothetical protein [Chitinophagales bacterium]